MQSLKLAGLFAGALLAMQVLMPFPPAGAEEAADPSKQKCEIAEVNPVTGHAICIKPIGAPVEKPPEIDDTVDCQPGDESTEDWSWSSKCRPEAPGQ